LGLTETLDMRPGSEDVDFLTIRLCLLHYPNSVERTGFPSIYHATDWEYVFNGFEENDDSLPW